MENIIEYREKDKKNTGVFALKKIKKGTLILTEKAQFKPKFEHGFECLSSKKYGDCKPCIEELMAAFNNMNPMDQDEYMKLSNKFDTEHFGPKLVKLERMSRQMFPASGNYLSYLLIADILGIYLSNLWGHDGSISLNAFRFKHSCSPNTNYYGDNKDVLIIKATSKIAIGEEITANRYCSRLFMKDLKTRQKFLWEQFGFKCQCDLCEMEAKDGDNFRYPVYANMVDHVKNLKERFKQQTNEQREETCRRGIASYKEMYKCAKECSANRLYIINDILLPGFDWAVAVHLFATKISNKALAETFKKEAECFAKAGLQIAEILFGKYSPDWRELKNKFKWENILKLYEESKNSK